VAKRNGGEIRLKKNLLQAGGGHGNIYVQKWYPGPGKILPGLRINLFVFNDSIGTLTQADHHAALIMGGNPRQFPYGWLPSRVYIHETCSSGVVRTKSPDAPLGLRSILGVLSSCGPTLPHLGGRDATHHGTQGEIADDGHRK
jgi:hypothetical protein